MPGMAALTQIKQRTRRVSGRRKALRLFLQPSVVVVAQSRRDEVSGPLHHDQAKAAQADQVPVSETGAVASHDGGQDLCLFGTQCSFSHDR